MNVYSKTETDSQIQKTNQCLPVREREGERVKQMKGIKKYKLPVLKQISIEDVLCIIENIINNIVITFVTDGNQAYHGDHFIMYKNIKSLCCTPEINIIS